MFRSFNSIKGELIPYLIKKQYRGKKRHTEQQNVRMSNEFMEEDSKHGTKSCSFSPIALGYP